MRLYESRSLEDRFWEKVVRDPETGCWEWAACRNRDGYGVLGRDAGEGSRLAHRIAHELLVGPIPAGLEIDHLCRNPGCVNPAHLEPVTQAENVRRSDGLTAKLHRAGHCKNGHAYAERANRHPNGTVAYCRVCRRDRRLQRATA